MPDSFNLQRFIEAQEPFYADVVAELTTGRKTTQWMWFIFPQLAGLAHSPMAQRYAISGHAEAVSYLRHPLLGERLVECTNLVLRVDGQTIYEILGSPDDLKFRSSMTLFAQCAPDVRVFDQALAKYFDGAIDHRVLERLHATSLVERLD